MWSAGLRYGAQTIWCHGYGICWDEVPLPTLVSPRLCRAQSSPYVGRAGPIPWVTGRLATCMSQDPSPSLSLFGDQEPPLDFAPD